MNYTTCAICGIAFGDIRALVSHAKEMHDQSFRGKRRDIMVFCGYEGCLSHFVVSSGTPAGWARGESGDWVCPRDHKSYKKLNRKKAAQIRARRRAGHTAYEIALVFDVSESCVRDVLSGKTWTN